MKKRDIVIIAVILVIGILITNFYEIKYFEEPQLKGLSSTFMENDYFAQEFAQSTNDNPFGIEGIVAYDPIPSMAFHRYEAYVSPLRFGIQSKQAIELTGYNICDGTSCYTTGTSLAYVGTDYFAEDYIKHGIPIPRYVFLEHLRYPVSWKIGDTVHIKIKIMNGTINKTNDPIRHPQRIWYIDLGTSKIINKTDALTLPFH